MNKNPFLDDAMNAKDEFLSKHENGLGDVLDQNAVEKFLPDPVDRQNLKKLIDNVNRQTSIEAKKNLMQGAVKTCSSDVLRVAKLFLRL